MLIPADLQAIQERHQRALTAPVFQAYVPEGFEVTVPDTTGYRRIAQSLQDVPALVEEVQELAMINDDLMRELRYARGQIEHLAAILKGYTGDDQHPAVLEGVAHAQILKFRSIVQPEVV